MVKKKKRSREVKKETIKSRRVICGKRSRAWPRMDDFRTTAIDGDRDVNHSNRLALR